MSQQEIHKLHGIQEVEEIGTAEKSTFDQSTFRMLEKILYELEKITEQLKIISEEEGDL